MNKLVKLSGIIAVAVLYCTVIYLVYGFANIQDHNISNQNNTDKESSYFGLPHNPNGYALPNKISLSAQMSLFDTSSSFSKKISTGIKKSAEQTFSKSKKRYIFQSEDLPVRLRIKISLFPFHIFW